MIFRNSFLISTKLGAEFNIKDKAERNSKTMTLIILQSVHTF